MKTENNELGELMRDVPFLERAVQQDPSNSAAFFFLGMNYYYGGNGVTKDLKKSFDYTKRAAELGHADAAELTAIAYHDGIEGVVNQDYTEATKWFLRAAEMGSTNSMYEST